MNKDYVVWHYDRLKEQCFRGDLSECIEFLNEKFSELLDKLGVHSNEHWELEHESANSVLYRMNGGRYWKYYLEKIGDKKIRYYVTSSSSDRINTRESYYITKFKEEDVRVKKDY